jgi:hypothetical protein
VKTQPLKLVGLLMTTNILFYQQEAQEQMVKRERLDLQVLQEAQEQLVQLAQQEIKEMWEQLDQLVPLDPQD